MAGKTQAYRAALRGLEVWDDFLLAESGLPGPRGNIELAQAVADEGSPALFQRYLAFNADIAPTNNPGEFLAFCAVVALGRLLAEGDQAQLDVLRRCSSDPRWRIREGVAMALQRVGDADMPRLIAVARDWSRGSSLEQRAAAAGLCEPRLLRQPEHARTALRILDEITATMPQVEDRRTEAFLTLRQGLGYCWSVAVAALPAEGMPLMEKWLACPDRDIQWVMRENLKKNRLARADAAWVERMRSINR